MIALIAALWAYDGWSDVSQMAGEIQNARSAPSPSPSSAVLRSSAALYMLTNAAIQYILPSATIAVTARPTPPTPSASSPAIP